jgi:hypothetical protein
VHLQVLLNSAFGVTNLLETDADEKLGANGDLASEMCFRARCERPCLIPHVKPRDFFLLPDAFVNLLRESPTTP